MHDLFSLSAISNYSENKLDESELNIGISSSTLSKKNYSNVENETGEYLL